MAGEKGGGFSRDLETVTSQMAWGIFSMFRFLIRLLRFGIGRLKKKKNLRFFLLSFLIPVLAYGWKEHIKWLAIPVWLQIALYGGLLFFPLLCLLGMGYAVELRQKKFQKIFEEIGFKGKNGKHPYFCGISEQGKKVIYYFKSNIPLEDWQADRAWLEMGLDCNILLLEEGKNKRIVSMTTVPNNYKIAKKIDWSDEFMKKSGTINVGRSVLDDVTFDLNRTPHVLIAGETGSGKSVILRGCLWQMINHGARVYMIDFKGGVEFGKRYEQYGEVITQRERALKVLTELVHENELRLALFRDLEVKNLDEYNRKTGQNLCRIGVFCDEIAEMLDKKGVGKEERQIYEQLEGRISTLARLSRATGINLILGVQRPDANVLTGQIKNNIPVRISGRFADKAASEIVLGSSAATGLPDVKGRFLYKVGNELVVFQGYFFNDDTMLHQVAVEPGDMLMETKGGAAPLSVKEKEILPLEDKPSGKGRSRRGGSREFGKAPGKELPFGKGWKSMENRNREEGIPEKVKPEADKYTEAEMEEMDQYDLNFDFEDMVNK